MLKKNENKDATLRINSKGLLDKSPCHVPLLSCSALSLSGTALIVPKTVFGKLVLQTQRCLSFQKENYI